MGVFISNSLTDRGRILLGAAQVDATFEATKIVMGSGYIPAGFTARTMTAVVAPVIELKINKKKRAGDGTVTFGGIYRNETITEAFYFREFALYARVQYADGTYSDEVLYSYGNAGDNADLMPAYSTSTVVEKQMDIVTWIGNETQVNLTVDSGLYNPHADKHAADGEDPLTPEMLGAVRAKPLGSYGAETTIAAQVQYWFDQHIRWGIFHAALCADLPPETVNWDHGVEFKVLSGSRVEITATSLNNRKFIRHYDAFSKSYTSEWKEEGNGLVDYDLIGDSAELHILNWAKAQKYSGTFMVGSRVSGLPRAEVFKGLLIVDQEDHFIHIWNARNAYFIATNATQFTTDWVRLGTTDADGNILVGEGYGAFAANGGSVLMEHRTNGNRTGIVVYAGLGTETRFKAFEEIGGILTQFDLYHTGNAPAVIATAELV